MDYDVEFYQKQNGDIPVMDFIVPPTQDESESIWRNRTF